MTWPVRTIAQSLDILTAPGAPFEMTEVEALGRRVRSYVRMPSDLRSVLDASRRYGARDFLVYQTERVTFEGHWRASQAFGRALLETYGLRKGDRVALAMRNFPEWSICAWGALAIGAVLVPLNAWEPAETLARLLDDCGAKVAVVDQERLERLAAAGSGRAIITVRAASDAPAGLGVDASDIRSILGPSDRYAELPDDPLPDPGLRADDLATIFYTSGTTGRPKGAMGTHRNILSNYVNTGFRAARAAVRRGGDAPAAPATGVRKILLPLPLFHVTGFHSTLMPAVANGSTLHLMYKWDVTEALEIIAREKIQMLNLVPTLAWQLLDALETTNADVSSLDIVGYGGSSAPPELARRVRTAFPNAYPGQGYGATETSSLVASNSHEDMMARPDSVGTAAPCCDVRIVTATGKAAEPGEPGELWVRGPNVVAGYWNMPDATQEAFVDGWYRTGDVARMDDEGFITILDRIKDMLIRGGENIYCAEIENFLLTHADVEEAAVFGLPERTLGEVVGAAIRLRPCATTSAEALSDYVRKGLGPHKSPVRIALYEAPLPRNAAGKLLKSPLRAALIQAQPDPRHRGDEQP